MSSPSPSPSPLSPSSDDSKVAVAAAVVAPSAGAPSAPKPSSAAAVTSVEETRRRLCSLQLVHTPQPIPGADLICLATVQGYRVVVRKSDFGFNPDAPSNESVRCVFWEVDSVLDPDNDDFKMFDKYHRRIKTQKLRGIISQGLAQSLTILQRYGVTVEEANALEIGADLTQLTKTKKYVAPEEADVYAAVSMGRFPFPQDVPKTDETNLQSQIYILKELERTNRVVTITEKADGTSLTVSHEKLCGRNFEWRQYLDPEAKSDASALQWAKEAKHYVTADERYKIREKLRKRFEETKEHIYLQCEVVGPTINANRMGLDKVDVRCFNIFSVTLGRYLPHKRVCEICDELGVPTVQIIQESLAVPFNELRFPHSTCDDWLRLVNGRYYKKGAPAEGVVVKTDDHDGAALMRIGFKVISPEYLAKLG